MISKPFDQIKKKDIDTLIQEKEPESKTLEYKEELPGKGNEAKKEFLADVASFANSSGGDIIFGIKEDRDENGKSTGVPKDAPGVANCANVEPEILRLTQVIRSGIAPQVSGFQLEKKGDSPEGPIILLRIPKSWAAPHMITVGDSRFYIRYDRSKHPMDVEEIRSAFNLSESLGDKITQFRYNRLGKILTKETPLQLRDGPKVVLHLIPRDSFAGTKAFDVATLFKHSGHMSTIRSSGRSHRFNYDGFLIYSGAGEPVHYSYIQLFRNSVIEMVDAFLIKDNRHYIPSKAFEEEVAEFLGGCLIFEKNLGITPPIVVLLSVLGIKDYALATRQSTDRWYEYRIDRDDLLFPDILIEDINSDPFEVLRPCFDILWQSVGFARCMHYDESGKWIGN
ncbi:helix-turn-helix domain-containing protein [Candidatus Neomarinimicrobiota bacterium]